MPKIGSKNARKTRHLLKSGFKKLLIRNEKDIELLLMNNRSFCGELANSLSGKKRYSLMFNVFDRKAIVERAKELYVRITKSTGKLKKSSAE